MVKIACMKHYFFKDLDNLDLFTMELERHQDLLECKKCSKNDQFVSHGYVYKKHVKGDTRTVGKRIFCSDRYHRSGCGSTLRLYLATELPAHQYTSIHLFIFLSSLIDNASIQKAYEKATLTENPRNAYRWLNKCLRKLTDYRLFLNKRTEVQSLLFKSKNKRRQLLLPTLQSLFVKTKHLPCATYQMNHQTCFL